MDDISRLNEQFLKLQTENFELSESLTQISMMLDNKGWAEFSRDIPLGGMDLNQLKESSRQLRELVVGNPLIKRGSKLRSSYVWSRGVNLPQLSSRVVNRMMTPNNERYVFCPEAFEEMELAAYTDGNVFVLGRKSDFQLSRISIEEITGVMTDPDNNEIIWAIRRSWDRSVPGMATEPVVRWYYTDFYPENRRKVAGIKNGAGNLEPVDLDYVMFYQSFNRQIGWTFGVPDALPAMAWARLYREFLENGTIMTKALAQFAYKLSSKGRNGVSNAAAKIAVPEGQANRVGATAAMGASTDLTPMPKAGSAYDFESGKSLAAMIAAGLEVSVVALLADPGISGSYGTAQTLDTPTQKAMEIRQQVWGLFFKRVLRFLGAPVNIQISWPSIETEPTHRMVQALAMAWESGVLNEGEYRNALLDILDIPAAESSAPRGVMLPNNTRYAQTKSNDANPDSSVVPAQGNSGSVGGLSDGDNQLRDQNL